MRLTIGSLGACSVLEGNCHDHRGCFVPHACQLLQLLKGAGDLAAVPVHQGLRAPFISLGFWGLGSRVEGCTGTSVQQEQRHLECNKHAG